MTTQSISRINPTCDVCGVVVGLCAFQSQKSGTKVSLLLATKADLEN